MDNFKISADFEEYKSIFLEENKILNLISKNDEKFLYEKHIYDSLSIKLFFEKYNIKTAEILDIGCGGGFPCVPVAIEFPNINIEGIDSIRKKINAVNRIKEKLDLKNLNLICERVENIDKKYDIVVSRAVAKMSKILEYAIPKLKKDGYFVAYKSKKALDELNEAETVLRKIGAKVVDIIEYTLPLDEIFDRCLVIVKR